MRGQAVALKEWAVAVEALRQGKQVLIMRKGGIREETKDFQVESEAFYLYPTYEHQKRDLIKPAHQSELEATFTEWSPQVTETTVRCYAELAEDILISSAEELERLRDFHIWTDAFAEERLKWKRAKPLHVMLLRVHELSPQIRLPIEAEYNGCKSWIGLPPDKLEAADRKPVLSDEAFAAAVKQIKDALQGR